MNFIDYLLVDPDPRFYSARTPKFHVSSFLKQYRQHQSLAASCGLLPDTVPKASDNDVPHRDEYPAGRLNEDNKLVLAGIRTTQRWLLKYISELDSHLAQLENALLATRKRVWVRTGAIALVVSAILTYVFTSFRGRHSHILGFEPRSLQPFVPLLPIAARERQISAVEAARARLEGLRIRVASSHPVTVDEISWMESEKWDGVNWGLVGL